MSESITHADLAEAALAYRRALDSADQLATAVEAELLEVRTRHQPTLEAAAADCERHRDAVLSLVCEAPHLFGGRFDKSAVAHGIRYGLRQVGGRWHWPEPAALLKLVSERLAPSVQARVVATTLAVKVGKLTPDDRKRLGIQREPVADAAFARQETADSIARLLALLSRPADAPTPDTTEATS